MRYEMARGAIGTKVYADAPIFFSVIKEEPTWPECMKVLRAAHRGDIQLVASTMLKIELIGWHGEVDLAARDALLEQYLDSQDVDWVEVDHFTIGRARELANRYHMRGPDALHLASAVIAGADYLMTYDKRFPLGRRIEGVRVQLPSIVWNETTEDLEVDNMASVQRSAEVPPPAPPKI